MQGERGGRRHLVAVLFCEAIGFACFVSWPVRGRNRDLYLKSYLNV